MSENIELRKHLGKYYGDEIVESKSDTIPVKRKRVNFISKVLFLWVIPIIQLGSKRKIEIGDIFSMLPDNELKGLDENLEKEWTVESKQSFLQTIKKGETPSLTKALLRTIGKRYFLYGVLYFIVECFLKIVQPVCLGLLLRDHFQTDNEDNYSVAIAYLYGTGVVVPSFFAALIIHTCLYEFHNISIHIKAALCSLIYKKVLRLNHGALGKTNVGQLVNLMSNDVNRFDLLAYMFHSLWIAPFQIAIATAILYSEIGISSFAGFCMIILFVPFQILMGRTFGKLRMKTAEMTDERVRNMGEMVSGIRVIKLYAWEELFINTVNLCRKAEVKVMRQTAFYRAINDSVPFSSSKLIIYLIFLVYIISGHGELTADKVFLTVALFDIIRINATVYFSTAITCVAETNTSIRRIEAFLLLDEAVSNNESSNFEPAKPQVDQKLVECKVTCQNLTVRWPGSSRHEESLDNIVLDDASFQVYSSQILAIIGQVGSGKSTLLHVILDELKPQSGKCEVRGSISYASQSPWLFSDGTIQQNILCGLDYDAKRYKKVIEATALEKDLTILPNGDQTIVGEKGTTLSGGQKARIGLARCIYIDADIYLFDDPFSAVDSDVGRHIIDHVVHQFLRGKIRIFVTHQLKYLKNVDQILIIENKKLKVLNDYCELVESSIGTTNQAKHESIEDSDEVNNLKTKKEEGDQYLAKTYEVYDEHIKKPEKHFDKEIQITGSIPISTYWNYIHSGASYFSAALLLVLCIVTQALFNASDYWLSIFIRSQQTNKSKETNSTALETQSLKDNDVVFTGISVYSTIIGSLVVFSFLRTIHFLTICTKSSIKLHNSMLEAIVRAPISFFEQNSAGSILNRFTKDLGCMDDHLPQNFLDTIFYSLFCIGAIVVVSVVSPWLILAVVFPAIALIYLTKLYVNTSRSVKRLEAISRSPVFSHASSSLTGLVTIRAHKCQERFHQMFDSFQEAHTSVSWILLATMRWFGFWTDFTCVMYVACVTYTCVSFGENLSSSEAGLVISSAMSLVAQLQLCVRKATETENLMTSVERVIEYSKIPSEACLKKDFNFDIGAFSQSSWPRNGKIQFIGVSLQYEKTGQTALKNISCIIEAKEKIGIVGRTGAGKSSFIAALFRLTEPKGKILIDDVDIARIGLHELRSKISIIPQDPVLFSGTLRKNLDPFNEYSDEVLWKSLEDVQLKESIPDGLHFNLTDGGSNLSVGERQLVCLARAIIRNNKILVLDEATANVDQRTDDFIQTTIRNKFEDCTVITIAHRLNTIMDSDRVIVMDAGTIKEFDEPAILLENKQSMFSNLSKHSSQLSTHKK